MGGEILQKRWRIPKLREIPHGGGRDRPSGLHASERGIERKFDENVALGAGFEPARTLSPVALEATALVLTRPPQQP